MCETPIRVRLDLTNLNVPAYKIVWFPVTPRALNVISDLKSNICRKFCLPREDIQLFVDGGLMQDEDTVLLLRENDVVQVLYNQSSFLDGEKDNLVSLETAVCKNKKKRKRKKAFVESNDPAVNDVEKKAKEICDISSPKRKKKKSKLSKDSGILNGTSAAYCEESSGFTGGPICSDQLSDGYMEEAPPIKTNALSETQKKTASNSYRNTSLNSSEGIYFTLHGESTLEKSSDNTISKSTPELFEAPKLKTFTITAESTPEVSKVSGFKTFTLNTLTDSADQGTKSIANSMDTTNQSVKSAPKKRKRRRKRKITAPSNLLDDTSILTVASPPPNIPKLPILPNMTFPYKVKHIKFSELENSLYNLPSTSDVNGHFAEKVPLEIESFKEAFSSTCKESTELDLESCSAVDESSKEKVHDIATGSHEVVDVQKRHSYVAKVSVSPRLQCQHSETWVDSQEKSVISKEVPSAYGGTTKKDYTRFEALNSLPSVGSTVAFKMLELSSLYCPEVSEYKEGVIVDIDSASDVITFELLKEEVKILDGKFGNVYEDEEPENQVTKQIALHWSELIDPRLLAAIY